MIIVLDSTDLDLSKHAYAQLKDFGVECETREVDMLNIPREIAQSDAEEFLVALEEDQKFSEQVVGKILDLEEEKRVKKVFISQESVIREIYEKQSRRTVREAAENIAKEHTESETGGETR